MAKKPVFNKYSDDDLDNLAQITEQDILDTHQSIITAVSTKFKNLVLAIKLQLFGDDNA